MAALLKKYKSNAKIYFFLYLGVHVSFNFESSLCLFVCLFVISLPLRIFHSWGDVTITSEELQILTYAQHSWPLSREGSLACHTYCDTGHPFIMVI